MMKKVRETVSGRIGNNFEILNIQPDIDIIKDRLALIQCLEATRARIQSASDIREGDVGNFRLGLYTPQEALLVGWI